MVSASYSESMEFASVSQLSKRPWKVRCVYEHRKEQQAHVLFIYPVGDI